MTRVPFARTSPEIVRRMLSLAGAGEEDLVLDLGSGSGSILVEAAKDFGSRAYGIEIDPVLVRLGIEKVKSKGLGNRIKIVRGDFLTAPMPKATIVTLYLLPDANALLARRLLHELPNAKVVAHQFPIPGWKPLEVEEYKGIKLYLYEPRISAEVDRNRR